MQAAEGPVTLKTADVAQISGDIMGQIYMRDFKMVDQTDMIVSFVPELPNGKPGLSSGVERELHHAFEGGKEVYVVWACRGMPSARSSPRPRRRCSRARTRRSHYFKTEGIHQVILQWQLIVRSGSTSFFRCQLRDARASNSA